VLPFVNHSGDKENDYLSDGMTEEIIVRLAKISSLRVIALRSVLHFKNSDKTLEQIGQELGVGTVLEGSIRFFQGRIRILVGLVDVSNLTQLWAETYDLQAADIFGVQREVAEQIASALRARFPSGLSDSSLASVRLPENLEAYHLYLKGRHAMGQISPDSYRAAIQLFRRALDLDATYSRSYAGLALCYATSGHLSFMPPKEAFTLAKAAAAKALEFQETLPDAHLAMALVYLWYEWRWDATEQELRTAAILSPNDPYVHLFQGVYWIIQGQVERAIREARRAMDLDPLSPQVSAMLGWVLCFAGQTDEAVEQLQRTLNLDPGYLVAKALLGETHLLKGNFDEAISIFEPWPWAKSHLATARALSGDTETAHKILAEIKSPSQAGYQSRYDIGMLCLALDLVEEGFDNLDKSFEERDPKLVFVRAVVSVTPHLEPVRQHPRYLRLLEKIGYRLSVN
jgi:TolB-like protein/Tfp pilus assembly protein PilF